MRFVRTLRISFEGTWRGIFESSKSNFLAIAWSANTGAIARVPWHGAIRLLFMVVPAIAGMSVYGERGYKKCYFSNFSYLCFLFYG